MDRGRGSRVLLRARVVLCLLVGLLAMWGPAACANPLDLGSSALVECPGYDRDIFPDMAPLAMAPAAKAGAIEGNFAVSSSGSATYSIPILVPPGRLGMEPKLSITYDSGGDFGLLGKGFSIAGLSSIHRCGSSVAQDGHYRGVELDRDDQLCLDGMRLVEVGTGADSEGPYREYRTFPDTQIKIIGYQVMAEDTALPRRTAVSRACTM